MTFSAKLKNARLAAGLSQAAAADLLDVSKSTYCNWEAGRTEPPTEPVMTQSEVLDAMRCISPQ
jgi:transcriptional regulator with XRE-family HTH domain